MHRSAFAPSRCREETSSEKFVLLRRGCVNHITRGRCMVVRTSRPISKQHSSSSSSRSGALRSFKLCYACMAQRPPPMHACMHACMAQQKARSKERAFLPFPAVFSQSIYAVGREPLLVIPSVIKKRNSDTPVLLRIGQFYS